MLKKLLFFTVYTVLTVYYCAFIQIHAMKKTYSPKDIIDPVIKRVEEQKKKNRIHSPGYNDDTINVFGNKIEALHIRESIRKEDREYRTKKEYTYMAQQISTGNYSSPITKTEITYNNANIINISEAILNAVTNIKKDKGTASSFAQAIANAIINGSTSASTQLIKNKYENKTDIENLIANTITDTLIKAISFYTENDKPHTKLHLSTPSPRSLKRLPSPRYSKANASEIVILKKMLQKSKDENEHIIVYHQRRKLRRSKRNQKPDLKKIKERILSRKRATSEKKLKIRKQCYNPQKYAKKLEEKKQKNIQEKSIRDMKQRSEKLRKQANLKIDIRI